MRTLFLHIIFFLINSVIILLCLEFSLGTDIFSIEPFNSPSNNKASVSTDREATMISPEQSNLYPSGERRVGIYPEFEYEIVSVLKFPSQGWSAEHYVYVDDIKGWIEKHRSAVDFGKLAPFRYAQENRRAPYAKAHLDPDSNP